MNSTARIIINEQHSLNPAQHRILGERFESFEMIEIPAQGLPLAQQKDLASDLLGDATPVVFVSPVPLLLAIMAGKCGRDLAHRDCGDPCIGYPQVFLFHNDSRSKAETAGATITSIVATEGWTLLLL